MVLTFSVSLLWCFLAVPGCSSTLPRDSSPYRDTPGSSLPFFFSRLAFPMVPQFLTFLLPEPTAFTGVRDSWRFLVRLRAQVFLVTDHPVSILHETAVLPPVIPEKTSSLREKRGWCCRSAVRKYQRSSEESLTAAQACDWVPFAFTLWVTGWRSSYGNTAACLCWACVGGRRAEKNWTLLILLSCLSFKKRAAVSTLGVTPLIWILQKRPIFCSDTLINLSLG